MRTETPKIKKVVVAMSGGIDSNVAAALLKKRGFNVVGVFMKLADLPHFKESEVRARKVAKILNIPFYVFNFEKEFKKRICDYFLDGYKAGLTPNPCVVCNKEIKFGLLLEKALDLGADYIATGHYARKCKIQKPLSRKRKFSRNLKCKMTNQNSKIRYKLLMGKDKEKDQSYFLWQLNQEQLKHILFPVGDCLRSEVEGLAKKFKLPFAGVKKSQEVCFVPAGVSDFLKKYLKPKPGQIICSRWNLKQEVVGEHQGLWFYTIGQRKGIGKLKIKNEKLKIKKGEIPPLYVIGKALKKNTLIVGLEKDLYKKDLACKNVNWISGKEPKFPLKVKAKIRYRSGLASATIYSLIPNSKFLIRFAKPQRAITPGQSVVFYAKMDVRPDVRRPNDKCQELLGGGIIRRAM